MGCQKSILFWSKKFHQFLFFLGKAQKLFVDSCLKFSALWNTVEVYHLTENMRVLMSGSSEVQRYSEWLLKVTNCNMTLSSINMLRLVTEKLVKEC